MSETSSVYSLKEPAIASVQAVAAEAGPASKIRKFWRDFNKNFPHEAACVEELFRRIAAESVIGCGKCGRSDFDRAEGSRICGCICGATFSFTAGTFFHRIRSCRQWLAAICAIEIGLAVNANQVSKLLDCAYATAHVMFRKLRIVIVQMRMSILENEKASAALLDPVKKRSRITPAGAHPKAEEAEFVKPSHGDLGSAPEPVPEPPDPFLSVTPGLLGANEKMVYAQISDVPIHSDTLLDRLETISVSDLGGSLGLLLAAGLITERGGRYLRTQSPHSASPPVSWQKVLPPSPGGFPRASITRASIVGGGDRAADEAEEVEDPEADAICDFIEGTFGGISRKYLQLYVCAFWYFLDHEIWRCRSLVADCLDHGYFRYVDTLPFVTPAILPIPLPLSGNQ